MNMRVTNATSKSVGKPAQLRILVKILPFVFKSLVSEISEGYNEDILIILHLTHRLNEFSFCHLPYRLQRHIYFFILQYIKDKPRSVYQLFKHIAVIFIPYPIT